MKFFKIFSRKDNGLLEIVDFKKKFRNEYEKKSQYFDKESPEKIQIKLSVIREELSQFIQDEIIDQYNIIESNQDNYSSGVLEQNIELIELILNDYDNEIKLFDKYIESIVVELETKRSFRSREEKISSNTSLIIDSGYLEIFVKRNNGKWSHRDWLDLMKEINDRVGSVYEKKIEGYLEQEKIKYFNNERQNKTEEEFQRREEELRKKEEKYKNEQENRNKQNQNKYEYKKYLSDEECVELLGISTEDLKDFSKIKSAYRLACRKNHPDSVERLDDDFKELAHKKMILINSAYDKLQSKFK